MAIATSQTEFQLQVDIPNTTTSSLSTIVARRIKESFTAILTKFHAGYFRVSLSFGGQALLWKTLIGPTDDSSSFRLKLHMFHPTAFTLLWGQLPIRSIDFLASFASISAILDPKQPALLRGSVVGFCGSCYGAGCENLWSMVYEREEVFIGHCKPDEPIVSDREPGGCTSSSKYGVERERYLLFFTWDGALFGAVRDALPAFIRHRSDSDDVKARFLLVLRCPEHGQLGLAIYRWFFRYCIKNALLSLALPLHVTGLQADTVQEMYEKVQFGMVGLLISFVCAGSRFNGVCGRSQRCRCTSPHGCSSSIFCLVLLRFNPLFFDPNLGLAGCGWGSGKLDGGVGVMDLIWPREILEAFDDFRVGQYMGLGMLRTSSFENLWGIRGLLGVAQGKVVAVSMEQAANWVISRGGYGSEGSVGNGIAVYWWCRESRVKVRKAIGNGLSRLGSLGLVMGSDQVIELCNWV
ncbi:hypothetical protein DITRI_Ditri10aG0020400 [Diplodiscus trichospermus]